MTEPIASATYTSEEQLRNSARLALNALEGLHRKLPEGEFGDDASSALEVIRPVLEYILWHRVSAVAVGRNEIPGAKLAVTELPGGGIVSTVTDCPEADRLHERITEARRVAIATMTSDKWEDLTEAEQDVILDALRAYRVSPLAVGKPSRQESEEDDEAILGDHNIPEGQRSSPAGALDGGSPADVARDATPGSAVSGVGGSNPQAEIETIEQALLEMEHAHCDPQWFSKGRVGADAQFSLWKRKGSEAIKALKDALSQSVSTAAKPELEEIKTILQQACDRDWKDETLFQTAVIAANAIYWRGREIAALKASVSATADVDTVALLRRAFNLLPTRNVDYSNATILRDAIGDFLRATTDSNHREKS